MPDSGTTINEDHDEGDELKVHQRWILGVAGLGCAVAGAVATFLPETNAGGVPILLVIGGAFGYVASTGQQLLHVNKDGVRLSQVRRLKRTLDDVVNDDSLPADIKVRIFETAHDNGIVLSGMDYESAVHAQLQQMGHDFGFVVHSPAQDSGEDFILSRPGSDKMVSVTLKIAPTMAARSVSVIRALKKMSPASLVPRQIIVNGPVSPNTRRQAELSDVDLVVWSPGTDFQDAAMSSLSRAGLVEVSHPRIKHSAG